MNLHLLFVRFKLNFLFCRVENILIKFSDLKKYRKFLRNLVMNLWQGSYLRYPSLLKRLCRLEIIRASLLGKYERFKSKLYDLDRLRLGFEKTILRDRRRNRLLNEERLGFCREILGCCEYWLEVRTEKGKRLMRVSFICLILGVRYCILVKSIE